MTAVEDLGYTPNFGARAMAAQRTKTIGAIIPTMENAVFARGIQAFQEELDTHGYTLLVASSSYNPDLEQKQIRSLVARGADALLLIGYARDPDIYRFTETRGIPTLITWAFREGAERPSIGFDNRQAMQALSHEVLRLGHRRIALITVDDVQNDRVYERHAGLQASLKTFGLSDADLKVYETIYSIETGGDGFAALMAQDPRPTVVICTNDVLAVGALKQAHAMGLRVPEDVSITGFDDLELARVTTPELTTLHVPHRDMGREAARALIARLEHDTPLPARELETRLCLRGSLGPAPQPH